MTRTAPSLTPRGKPIGRPRKQVPAGAVQRIAKASAEGASIVGIAAHLGVNVKTFNHWLEEDPALKEAIDLGRERERHILHSGLVRAAHKGNIVAATFHPELTRDERVHRLAFGAAESKAPVAIVAMTREPAR